MKGNTDKKKQKRKLILSGVALALSGLVLVISYAWFYMRREMSTVAWIKAPIVLDIRAGNGQDIKYLDMGNIAVGEGDGSKDYVFCVYGKPVDNYSLQLAYTTNIAFHYDVYRADLVENGSGEVTFESPDKKATFNIVDKEMPVISGLSMNEIKARNESPEKYQSHALSYGDEKKENIVGKNKVQKNNEPLYFLAEENGVKVMKPRNISEDHTEFLDYYVLRVSWKAGEVHEDKETDIVYLTASR